MLFAGPAGAQIACRADQKASAVVEMMFGRKIGDRVAVTNSAWARFVDREITPRFPDGLSVVDAAGQWQDPVRKRVVREPSRSSPLCCATAKRAKAKSTRLPRPIKSNSTSNRWA